MSIMWFCFFQWYCIGYCCEIELNTNDIYLSIWNLNIPYSSILVISCKSLLSYRNETFGLNHMRRVLMIFFTTNFYLIVAPSPVIKFTISSIVTKYEEISSSSFILRVSNSVKSVCSLAFVTLSFPW